MTTPSPGPLRRLARQALCAAAGAPAYRALWTSAGLDVAGLESLASLDTLPIVTRHDLGRFEVAQRCVVPLDRRGLTIERTGGSTGRPFDVPVDGTTRRRRRQRFLRALAGCGYRAGSRLMLLTVTTRPPVVARALNWHYVPLTLDDAALAAAYRRVRPSTLYGPLNTLLALASALGADRDDWPRPARVISTAEELTALARRRLAAAYAVDPADFYGMTETGLLAWRAGGTDHYRVADDDLLLEFLPCDQDPLLERVLVTDLGHSAMPLLRFDTGDLARRDPAAPGRPIVGFVGRTVDSLLLPDGRRLSPYRVTLAMEEVGGIEQYRVTQRADLAIDCTVWPARAGDTAVLDAVARRLRALLGDGVQISLSEGGATEPAQRKFRPVQSLALRAVD